MKKQNWKIKLGIGLILFSILCFFALPIIPFIEMESDIKIKLTTVVFIIAEVTFYTGGFFVGKELFTKYKSYFNPKNWFKKSKKEDSEIEREEKKEKEGI